MSNLIEIVPLYDCQNISFSDIVIRHKGCNCGSIKTHRNPATNNWSLRCDCGFEITNMNDSAVQIIERTAIDLLPRELATGTFSCNKDGAVSVLSQPNLSRPS